MRNVKTPRFQQRHYEFLADVIGSRVIAEVGGSKFVIARLVRELRSRLKADNPKFDGERFAKACGITFDG